MKWLPSYLAAGLGPRGSRGVNEVSRGASPAAKWGDGIALTPGLPLLGYLASGRAFSCRPEGTRHS